MAGTSAVETFRPPMYATCVRPTVKYGVDARVLIRGHFGHQTMIRVRFRGVAASMRLAQTINICKQTFCESTRSLRLLCLTTGHLFRACECECHCLSVECTGCRLSIAYFCIFVPLTQTIQIRFSVHVQCHFLFFWESGMGMSGTAHIYNIYVARACLLPRFVSFQVNPENRKHRPKFFIFSKQPKLLSKSNNNRFPY